ncbi:ferredoxin [Amycolatopsis sp.]|uniref:ferredoxin n=1 Tax=Amycolatopsis sp. TaxID=37632 RepID=UPI002C4A2EF7|nr:ferredoxin [Amycolatopsis sp.]HVV11891.1 ferredoxin [Amycolatopsis sp.]
MMLVRADTTLCQGYSAFDVDDDGMVVLPGTTVSSEQHTRVEAAVRSCSGAALAMSEEPESAGLA